jgi:hypothetical protein
MFWTPEEQAALAQLVAQGYSASQIARRMDTTRSAIIGRCGRTNIKLRGGCADNNPCRRDAVKRAKKPKLVKASKLPPPSGVPASLPSVGPVSSNDLGLRQCRYIGERPELLMLDTPVYCGQATDGGSWCPEHRARVLAPARPTGTA